MSPQLVGLLAAIFAAQARVEAMKAENAHRLACGNSVAYGEESFLVEAAALEHLADAARNAP